MNYDASSRLTKRGAGRIVRWKAAKPGSDADEFSTTSRSRTQNYVKRILGTAEDYRHLYGESARRPRMCDAGRSTGAAGRRHNWDEKKATPHRKEEK